MKVELTQRKEDVTLAISGGVDSMVLLDLFATRYAGTFNVVTVNHNLRQNSAEDAHFVQLRCEHYGVNCKSYSVNVNNYATQHSLSTETAARILRHRCLQDAACGGTIVTAHHLDDQAETVLLHLIRGSGTKGLCGMSVDDGKYWRPLLNISKQELINYATQNNLPYVQDETNYCDDYTRNFLRNQVMPLLVQLNSSAAENIARCALLAAQDQSFMERVAEVTLTANPLRKEDDQVDIPVETLLLNPAIASRCAFVAFAELGVTKDIEQKHIDDLLALAGKNVGKRIDLPYNHTATRTYDSIRLEKNRQQPLTYVDSSPFGVGTHQVGGKKIIVRPIGDNAQGNLFAYDKVPEGAVLRTRRQGDKFTKFGGGTKKLTDYLTDKKIPLAMRDSLVLLAEGSEVLIIVGVEISEKLKVTTDSQQYTIYEE